MRLKLQPARQAMVAGHDGAVQAIWTVPIPKYTVTEEDVAAFCRASLVQHGVSHADAKRRLEEKETDHQISQEERAPPFYEPVAKA